MVTNKIVKYFFFIVYRWSQHILRSAQYFRPHRDVLLLHGSCDGSQVPEIHMVEEVPHRLPDGKWYYATNYTETYNTYM